jgi:hypothetical protein
MESFNQLKALVEGVQADVDKVDAGQKAAVVRVRAAMQQIKALCKDVRDDAQAIKKAPKASKA